MSATGIGAAVRRKEDQRFVTGKGHYTDDVNRAGQCHAYFLRSPHAHAKIKTIDSKAAAAMPGVLAVLTGAELAADKIGNLICGWMITSKDGSQMKMAPHPAIAHGKVNYVGDAVAVVIAETLSQAKDAAEKVKVDYQLLPAVADPAKAQGQGALQIHEVAARNTIYQWHLGDANAVGAAFRAAKHVTKLDLINNRLVPNAIEPRAAIGEYDAGSDSLTLWNTTQNPHVARLVMSAFVGLAPDVGGGFGSKIFIYPEEVVCLWAARKIGRPVKWVAERSEAFLTDAHGRDHVTHAEMAFDADGKVTSLRVRTIANLGAYMSTFSSSVPTYLYGTLLSGQYEIPAIYCEVDAVYTNTVPVDAYRGAGRPEATITPRSKRRWRSPTTEASASASASPPARTSCAASASPPISRPAGLRRAKRSARSAAASGCGSRRRCASIPPARSKFSPAVTSTVRATRPPLRRSYPNGWASRSTRSASCTAIPTRCNSAWALMARARARSASPRS